MQKNCLVVWRRHSTFGSKNTVGFGSRMHANNNPFACFGLRGMTTYHNKVLMSMINYRIQTNLYSRRVMSSIKYAEHLYLAFLNLKQNCFPIIGNKEPEHRTSGKKKKLGTSILLSGIFSYMPCPNNRSVAYKTA